MAKSYENLKVWQAAIRFATNTYAATKSFPKNEQFGIVSQIRRAVVSVPANIAEGSSRTSKKDYARFVEIAIGSLNEVENFIVISNNLGFLDNKKAEEMREEAFSLGVQLGGFKKYLLR